MSPITWNTIDPAREIAADGSLADGFNLAPAWLSVFNAMDENGLEHQPPGPHYRRHRITGAGH